MKNIKLSIKLIGGFALSAIITLLVGVVGYMQLVEMNEHIKTLGEKELTKVETILEMKSYMNGTMIGIRTLMSPNIDINTRKEQYEVINRNRNGYIENYKKYTAMEQTPAEKELNKEFLNEDKKWSAFNNLAIEISKKLIEADILNPEAYLKNLWSFTSDHNKLLASVGELLITGKELKGGADPNACHFGKWFSSYSTSNPEITAILKSIKTSHDKFHHTVTDIKKALNYGQTDEASKLFLHTMIPAAEEVFEHFSQLREKAQISKDLFDDMSRTLMTDSMQAQKRTMVVMNKLLKTTLNEANEAVEQANAGAQFGKTLALIGMICGVIMALAFGIILTRGITKPIFQGVAFAQGMANGDFSKRLDVDQRDEIGILANALNEMVNKLRDVVLDVQSAADNVAAGSEEMSSASQGLSQGATEQAASIEEVSSSMEQMGSNISQNATNAVETQKISKQAAIEAQKGGEAVRQTVQAMKDIAEKISIIEEIARQTNLLALNAAIEAARAGEHGKGFAVVAAEVRKLAERSGSAAAEISDLSSTSVEVAENAGEMLHKIVPDIQKTAELIEKIAAASNEQNAGANQINTALQQLDQVIQQNAAASEEMASTSEELSGQANQMQSTISFFRIGNTPQSAHRGMHTAPSRPSKATKSHASTKLAPKTQAVSMSTDYDDFEHF